MYKVLIIEDDKEISSILKNHLEKWGYETQATLDFSEIMTLFKSYKPHIVLLDINLPYFDGFYWCSKIREISEVPIIFISSRDGESDKIRGITQGGDDYIEKPFSMDLLTAKISALLRRAYSMSDQSLNLLIYKDIVLNVEKFQLAGPNCEVEITKNECRILSLLIKANGGIVKRSRIMSALWDDESFVDDNTLTVNVNRLRKKLAEIGAEDYIRTIKGEGYKMI